MTTTKKQAAKPNKAIKAANDNALKGFPKAKLRGAFEARMAGSGTAATLHAHRRGLGPLGRGGRCGGVGPCLLGAARA